MYIFGGGFCSIHIVLWHHTGYALIYGGPLRLSSPLCCSANFVTGLPASLSFQCFSAATLLNSHAQRPRSAATLSGHAQRQPSAATLSGHAQRPRSAAMLSGYIQQPRSAATLSGHAQRPRSAATLSGHVPQRPRSAATLLSGHAPQQPRSCSLCPIHFSLSTSTSGKVNN